MSKDKLDHIHLLGNIDENFYTLGVKDKLAYPELMNQLSSLSIKNNYLAKIIKKTTEFSQNFVKKNHSENMNTIKAYSEGLDQKIENVMFSLLLPEMVASFNKWAPNLLGLIPGCSSLFLWDKSTQSVIHSRVLDYSLNGPFEANERSVLYDFKGRYKIFSYSSAGIALPALSAMNEKGLTLALHYKHSNFFNLSGESIFFIANDILSYAGTIREALKVLRQKQSIGLWGIYLSDQNGDVAAIDICGNEIHHEKYSAQDHDYLYFNNRSLVHKKDSLTLQPYGNLEQCKMRFDSIKEVLKNTKLKQDKYLEQSLEVLSSIQNNKAQTAKDWKLSACTPSSIQLYSFNNKKMESLYTLGPAPKNISNDVVKITDIFGTTKQSSIKFKKILNEKELRGHRHLSSFQAYFDTNKISNAYHSIQMSIELFQGQELEYIAKFYFYITEYIYEIDKRDLAYLYDSFLSLENKLPEYLNDHRVLFLLRLDKLLGHKITNRYKEIKNPMLKDIYLSEFKLNSLGIKGLKHLIFPRIDILDIIYAY